MKNAICRRDGALRSILMQTDIAGVMTALSRVASNQE